VQRESNKYKLIIALNLRTSEKRPLLTKILSRMKSLPGTKENACENSCADTIMLSLDLVTSLLQTQNKNGD
jgi:hypothetical protein